MIWYHTPWDSGKNIGKYYNEAMDRLRPREWACFVDADAMFTTPDYGRQLEEIVAVNPDYGLLYAMTNRIGCRWQQAGVDWANDDMAYHRKVGAERKAKHEHQVVDVSDKPEGGSGFFILLRKDAWLKAGPFLETGMLGVDWAFFEAAKKAGVKVGLMPGVYLYHWYRGGNAAATSHLK